MRGIAATAAVVLLHTASITTFIGGTGAAIVQHDVELAGHRDHQIMTEKGHDHAAQDKTPEKIRSSSTNTARQLSRDHHGDGYCRSDDALDPLSPRQRSRHAYRARKEAAKRERDGTKRVCQFNNGETDTAAKFHKTLPHDKLGQVDHAAFAALQECIYTSDFDKCEAIPAGKDGGYLINPIAGTAVDMIGPASSSVKAPPVPKLDSPELAAQLAEVYWMALARDVPFSQYDSDDVTVTAATNLANMEGFGVATGVAIGVDGSVDPSSQLFRASFRGVETGPMVSQLLVKDFSIDSITVTPKQNTQLPGKDYMTRYDDWLHIQNGGTPDGTDDTDPEKRYIRNARDMARLVATDTIYSEAFRGALVLFEHDAISKPGFNGPYVDSDRQKGFVEFGTSHVMKILGICEQAQRASWYQKWNVHLFARPEALAGTVHNMLIGALRAPIDASLTENWELLDRVAAANWEKNDGGEETYLLSQATAGGSPAHPSYPAGHAVQNGAFATVLKALVGLERGDDCFSDPVYPDDDGLELLPYTGDCLTHGGEINKLATNVAIGRQMMGVHYRFDSAEGLILGETIAIRMLQQEVMSFPVEHPYDFRLFTGETIRLYPDGTFTIDGYDCKDGVYTGVDDC